MWFRWGKNVDVPSLAKDLDRAFERPGLAWLFSIFVATWIVVWANTVRPLPFTTTDDNWMYFLPLIKAHTDALIQGEPLRVLWGLGAGWSPWENAQVGVLYLPYHLANLGARALGHPLALLEVSAGMHLAASGIVTYALAPRSLGGFQRFAWGLGAMLLAGPLLLGLNWHNYLTCTPWFLALAFLLRRIAVEGQGHPSKGQRWGVWIASLGLFLSAHAQMYVLGVGLLALWVLTEAPWRSGLRTLAWLLWAQLPMAVPLLYLKVLAAGGTADWMGDRDHPFFLLRHAQSLSAVLHGTVLGNLVHTRDFQLWANIRWTGVGMFFAPGLVLLVPRLWRARAWGSLLLFAGCLAFMGAASFPWMRHMAFGPLEGFRWTWKLCIFVTPLAWVSLIHRLPDQPLAWPRALPFAIALLGLPVLSRGLTFEIWPSLEAAHPFGAEGMVVETRRMAEATGLRPGTRIALAGPFDMVQPLPIPVLGLVGNAPLLSGLDTAHLYEPMEPEWVSRGHLGLSLPWRMALSAEGFLREPDRFMPILAAHGIQAVVTVEPGAAALPGAREYLDSLQRRLWVVPVPGAPAGIYPAASGALLQRRPSGGLQAPPSPEPPRIQGPRPVVWRRTDRGWEGCPPGLPWPWAWATLLVTLGGLLVGVGRGRPQG